MTNLNIGNSRKTPSLPANQVLQGDVRQILRTLPSESVDMVVTSPPYWGLRAYGTSPQIWDGKPGCPHDWNDGGDLAGKHGNESNGMREDMFDDGHQTVITPRGYCRRCLAWRGELGLEPYFFEYIRHLCEIFDEIHRVLKSTGTLWVNLGDTYGTKDGMQKSLCQIPSRFAIEMCARGWILRNELIWWKPNCMPTSAKDRFTVDFEKIFFFSKNRSYYFDPHYGALAANSSLTGPEVLHAANGRVAMLSHKRNAPPSPAASSSRRRSVWRVTARRFPDAHFAVYPPALLETPIQAGCPEFVCTQCGTPREKVYEGKSSNAFNIRVRDVKEERIKHVDRKASASEVAAYDEKTYGGSGRRLVRYSRCECNVEFEPGVVLDPFLGSGTTAVAALSFNRSFVGIELNPDYASLAKRRIRDFLTDRTSPPQRVNHKALNQFRHRRIR